MNPAFAHPQAVLAESLLSGACCAVQLTLPAPVEARLSTESASLHLAIGLFVAEEVTLGQGVEIAGLSQAAFRKELGKRRIPIHYGPEELTEDLRTIEARCRG